MNLAYLFRYGGGPSLRLWPGASSAPSQGGVPDLIGKVHQSAARARNGDAHPVTVQPPAVLEHVSPAGLPARECGLAVRHVPRPGRRSPGGASPTPPGAGLSREPGASPTGPAPAATTLQSCRRCTAPRAARQARGRAPMRGAERLPRRLARHRGDHRESSKHPLPRKAGSAIYPQHICPRRGHSAAVTDGQHSQCSMQSIEANRASRIHGGVLTTGQTSRP